MSPAATQVIQVDPRNPAADAIDRAATVIQNGGLVAFPTETVYGLGANALTAASVRKIFVAKQRPDWDPLIIHVSGLAMARSLVKETPPAFEQLAVTFWPGPLTLVVQKVACIPDEVTAGRPTVALRMPHHPVAAALLAAVDLPIAAPSANRFGRPSPTRAEHVLEDLQDRIDLILDAGPTNLGVESTIVDLTQAKPVILRPGGISREALETLLGPVGLAPGVAEDRATHGLAAPGMTLKHYAPRATLELFKATDSDWQQRMQTRAAELHSQGKRVGIVTSNGNLDEMARDLFYQLRVWDAQGAEIILCELPPPTGLGLAVRDRLLRAAGLGTGI